VTEQERSLFECARPRGGEPAANALVGQARNGHLVGGSTHGGTKAALPGRLVSSASPLPWREEIRERPGVRIARHIADMSRTVI
jgi:hypothetical protein